MTDRDASWSCLTHLECSATAERLPAGRLSNLSPAGAPLLARYDLEAAAGRLTRAAAAGRPPGLWRYREVLPAPTPEAVVSLGEGGTPLVPMPRLARRFGVRRLLVKDEGRNPTGSFKDRGMAVAVTMAAALGARALAVPSAGNAGGSAAAYGARAGLEIHVFVPEDAPRANWVEARRAGARVSLVRGFLQHCGALVAARSPAAGWFELSTFKEPYRVEGKKTMGYELAEQLGGRLPDVILYPTGGGTGLVALWKAFAELEQLGWIGSDRPRLVSVQAEGCAPLARAFRAGAATAEEWSDPTTRVAGLRAPRLLADRLCLEALRASGGTAVTVPDEAMFAMVLEAGAAEGLSFCPEGAACLAALAELRARGEVGAEEEVVVFNTASGLKYLDLDPPAAPALDPEHFLTAPAQGATRAATRARASTSRPRPGPAGART